jgi:hypothetical protein
MAVDPMTLASGVQIASNVAKLPLAIYQLVKAAQLRRNRPEYDIPEEVMQNQNIAKTMAMEGLPAAQYNRGQANIDRNMAFGLRQANSRRGGLVGLAGMEQAANDAYANLDVADANARRQNQQVLMGQNQNVAQYRDKAFQLNELEPWQIDMQAAAANEGAGINNLFNMFNKVSDTTGQMQFLNLWKSVYGGNTGGEGEMANAKLSGMGGNPIQSGINLPEPYNSPMMPQGFQYPIPK